MRRPRYRISENQKINPFDLPTEWDDEFDEEDYDRYPGDPVPEGSTNPSELEHPVDRITFEDELHDKWDLTSQPLNQNWR